ncbi:MAG: energy transducer TonB [Sphingomonadales bacterium]|nr:energy transducer TonB [Sphingomonadales bacterium]
MPTAAAEKAPISLAKVGNWEMRYDEDGCNLMGSFGVGRENVLLVISRTAPSDWFEMKLFGESFRESNFTKPLTVAFGNKPPIKRVALAGKSATADRLPVLIVTQLRLDGADVAETKPDSHPISHITPQQENAATSITVSIDGGMRYRLETGSFGPLMAAIRTCTDNLVRHWGYDPQIEASLVNKPIPSTSPGTWLTLTDYPRTALAHGTNGYVNFRLDVDDHGAVTGCHILFRTSPDEFSDLSCALLRKRARFEPARDAENKPVRSFFTNSVRWMTGY